MITRTALLTAALLLADPMVEAARAQNAADLSFRGVDSAGNSGTLGEKGFTIATAEEAVKFRIGGRMHFDFGTARIRDFRFDEPYDGSSAFRRSWIEGYLTILDAVELAFQYDLADPTRPINDAVLAFTALDPVILSVGNMKEPFSLDQLMSNNNTLFTERSLADVFAPARNFGFAAGASGDSWTLTAGAFGGNANTGIVREGVAGTARATWAPLLSKDEVLHVGIAGGVRSLDRRGPDLSLAVSPESVLFDTALVDTDSIARATSTSRIGLEAAYQLGGLRLQGEYIWTGVERLGGQPSARFEGGYVEAGWTVNGNGRPYEIKPNYGTTYAIFGAPKLDDAQRVTRGGPGIFELGVRVSLVDLTDKFATRVDDIRGGRETNYTFGLNWYPEPNLKIMANYVRAHAFNSPAADRGVDSDIFVGRVQVYW